MGQALNVVVPVPVTLVLTCAVVLDVVALVLLMMVPVAAFTLWYSSPPPSCHRSTKLTVLLPVRFRCCDTRIRYCELLQEPLPLLDGTTYS